MTRRHISVVPALPQPGANEWLRAATAQRDGQSLLHVAADAEDLPRLASVIAAVDAAEVFEQLVLDVGAGPGIEATLGPLGALARVHHLLTGPPEVPEDVYGVLEEYDPTTVVIHVDDQVGLCCAIAAAQRGISVVRIGGVPESGIGRVIARLADVLLTRSEADALDAPFTLAPERVTVVGNPLVDVVQRHARAALDAAVWRRCGVAPGDYVLAVLTGRVPLSVLEPALIELAARNALVLEAPTRWKLPAAHRFAHLTFLDRLSLKRTAKVIVTDSARVREEAAVLGVPCHMVDAVGVIGAANLSDERPTAVSWDERAGERASNALTANFARLRLAG